MESMGVASGCGYVGVVVRRYIDFLILPIPTLVSVLFCSSIPTFCSFLTLGTHARSEGYCSCPVCVCMCVHSNLPPHTLESQKIPTDSSQYRND